MRRFSGGFIRKKMSYTRTMENNESVCYINVPYAAMVTVCMRVHFLFFFLYLFSVHIVAIAFLLPGYALGLYYLYMLWRYVKIFGYRIPPFLLCILLWQGLTFGLAMLARLLLMFLIFRI